MSIQLQAFSSKKTALLMYDVNRGSLESLESTRRKIIDPNAADVFFFSYNIDPLTSNCSPDFPRDHFEKLDITLISHGLEYGPASEAPLSFKSRTKPDAVAVDYLYANFRAIERLLVLLEAYEDSSSIYYDFVVLCRSDISWYSQVLAPVEPRTLHMPFSRGIDEATGGPRLNRSLLLPYRDHASGNRVPPKPFNTDLLVLCRKDLVALHGAVERAGKLLSRGAPADLSSLLYLMLVERAGLQPITRLDWIYEIASPNAEDGAGANISIYPQLDVQELQSSPEVSSMISLTQPRPKRTAVLLYGLLRQYRSAAGSLMKNVVLPANADLFYYGPAESDRPSHAHGGKFDERGFFISNPKGDFEELVPVQVSDLHNVYGPSLCGVETHKVSQQEFLTVAEAACPREEWLFMLSPHRLLSMFFNITGVVKLLREYEKKHGVAYDEVILTRPDIGFYTPLDLNVAPGEFHIPDGEGFDLNGCKHRGNAPAYFYKSLPAGTFIPGGRGQSFNDQVIALRREDLTLFYNLYERLIDLLHARVPASPETIFYLILVTEARLRAVPRSDWVHEIVRADTPDIKNVSDTPDILNIDPRHMRAAHFKTSEEVPAAALQPRLTSVEDVGSPLATTSVEPDAGSVALVEKILGARRYPSIGLIRSWCAKLLLSRARRSRRIGRLREAEARYLQLLQVAPYLHREWIQYGHVLKDRQNFRSALAAYAVATDLAPSDLEARECYQRLQAFIIR